MGHCHAPKACALAEFNPEPIATAAMMNTSLYHKIPLHPDADEFWKLFDYGSLSQQNREGRATRNAQD